MPDKTELLRQLKIDRTNDIEGQSRLKWWIGAGLVLLVAAALLFFALRSPAIPVTVAIAHQVSPGSAGGGASLLDASGYVVARRQATVSAKITGKVTEVLIEEGQHVDKGAIVGRLDDTNVRAALQQAQAQLEYSKAALTQVQVNLANAERDFRRKNELFAQHFVSQSDLDNARTALDSLRAQLLTSQKGVDVSQRGVDSAQRNLDDTVVRAPFSGVITVKAVTRTGGWKDIELKPLQTFAPEVGLRSFTLVGTPPTGVATQALTPVSAMIRIDPLPADVKTIRVLGESNEVAQTFR